MGSSRWLRRLACGRGWRAAQPACGRVGSTADRRLPTCLRSSRRDGPARPRSRLRRRSGKRPPAIASPPSSARDWTPWVTFDHMLRAAGIVALIVLAACNEPSAKPSPSPTPIVAQGSWTQNLTFAGELSGHMAGIVPDVGVQKSQCTGGRTHSGEVWGVVFQINNFRGPGTYQNSSVTVEVHNGDATKVWQSRGSDKITFVLDRSQQSGTVDAMLTNATTGKDGLQVTGHWNCRQ